MRPFVPRKVLILGHADRCQAQTIADHLLSFARHSRHRIRYADPVGRPLPAWLDLNRFDAIVLHYSIYLLSHDYLGPDWRAALGRSSALKLLFLQDEYRRVLAFHQQIRQLGIHILYTCHHSWAIPHVYPAERLPGLRVYSTLTGWVPSTLEAEPVWGQRPIDLGYRSRGEGLPWLGELFADKARIGREFAHRARGSGLVCDISLNEADRIYGPAWLNFLRRCRATLGAESGASVIDFTGEIEEKSRHYLRHHPEATLSEIRQACFPGEDGRIPMGQISPRIFESIACGTALVLFPGHWSGILEAERHYLPLEKDFSNFSQILTRLRDRPGLETLARRTWREIIARGLWSERRFVAEFDEELARNLPPARAEKLPRIERQLPSSHNPSRLNSLLPALCYHAAFRLSFWLAGLLLALRRRGIKLPLDGQGLKIRGRRWLEESRRHWRDWRLHAELARELHRLSAEMTRMPKRERKGPR